MLQVKQEKGVTLVELLIVVVILGILASVAGNLLIGGIRFWRLSRARTEIQRDARTCLDLIHRELRQAEASSIVVDRLDDQQPPCSQISFTKVVTGDAIIYSQEGAKLSRSINGTKNFLAENLRHITFVYPRTDDEKIIAISICFEKETYGGGEKSLHLSVEKVRIMNE